MKESRNKAWRGVLAPGLCLLFLTFCNLTTSVVAQQTLLFGMAASLTGPYSEWSDAVNGFKLWESTLNAAGGISIRDINGTVYKYNVKLVVRDDASTAAGHAAAVTQLLNTDQVHFVLGASPVFAESETIAVQAAGRLNFQCCAGAATIYARDQKNVFGMSVDNALFTQELFTEYRSNNVYKIAVVYREDIQELASQCQGVIAQAKSQLLTVTLELKYSNGTNATLSALADQITAAPEEALIMCGLASESSDMIRAIDARRKPLKSIVMTGGAYTRDWNDALGELSVSVTSLAHWSPDLPRKDDFWGDAPTYAGKYKSVYQKDATQWAAAASATGYVLHTTLAGIFRRCTLSPAAAANPTTLFFTQDAINCADNNNRGHDRLIAALPLTNMDSVYGTVSFNRFRQNQGYDPVTLQTYEVTENLKLAFKPSLVLPLLSATRPLLLPQANRYIEICQPGTFRGPDAFVPCTECPAGQFQEFSGKTNCELCPKDYFGNTTAMPDCLTCPDNTLTIQRGSTNLTDCICKPGYFNRLGLPGLPCEACPKNAYCEGGTTLPAPDPGFYAEQSAPFTMYPCNPSSVCNGNFTCAKGYRGRMCAYCAEGHYRFLGNCVSCPADASAVIGYLLVMALLWITINVSFARAVENLMVIINFCQMLSIVVGFSLNWPQMLYSVMSFSSILSFEMDSLEPTCLVRSWGFANNLVVQLLLPLIMAGLVALWCGVTYAMYKYKQWGMTRSVRAAASLKMSQEAPWKQVMWAILDVPQDIRELRECFLERAAVPLNFLNIGYLVLLKYCLSTYRCQKINGVMYLYMSPNDMCYTTKHWNLMLLGTAGLIVYTGGFIYLYGHAMRALSKSRCLGDKKPLLLYGWMYERYEAQFYWYEAVIILQRTGFVLVSLFVLDPALQAVLCMIICVAVLLLDIRTSSYVDKQIHILQAGVDGALGAVLVAGLLFYNPLVSTTVTNVVSYVLLALVLAAFGSAAISVAQRLVVTIMLLWLMSKHRPIAYKMGQRVRGYRHMYQVFGAGFLFNWLRRCTAEEWDDWHKLCMVLIDYVHPTSEVSYLSLKKVGRFWRYLLSNFPETIDYLASVSEDQREHFNSFIEVLYDNFFDTQEEHHTQLNFFVQDKFKAAFAQWLSSCDEEDRDFCQSIMKTAVSKARGAKAANELTAAMTRSSKQLSNVMSVASAVDKFKRGLHKSGTGGGEGATSGKSELSGKISAAQVVVGEFDRSTHHTELDGDSNAGGAEHPQMLPHAVSTLDETSDEGGAVQTGLFQRGQRSGTAASGSHPTSLSGGGGDGERLVLPTGMAAALAAAKAPSVASGYRDSGSGSGGSRQGSGRRAGSARRAPSGAVELVSGRSSALGVAKAPPSPGQLQAAKVHDNALFGTANEVPPSMEAAAAAAAGGAVRTASASGNGNGTGTPPRSAPGTPRSATAKLHVLKAASPVGGLALDMGINMDVEELHLGGDNVGGGSSTSAAASQQQPPAAGRAPSYMGGSPSAAMQQSHHRLGTASGAPPRTPPTASLFSGLLVRGPGTSWDGGGGSGNGNGNRNNQQHQPQSAAGGDVVAFERQDTIPE